MTEEKALGSLKETLAVLRRPAWEPVIQAGDGPRTVGKFAGLPYLAANEGWPSCGGCGKPMAFLVQLDTAALPAHVRGEFGPGLLQLFYCTHCNPWEPFTPGSLARRIVPYGAGNALPCPVSEPFPPRLISGWKSLEPEFPCWDELPELLEAHGIDLSDDEQELYGEEIAPAQGEKLAGWPFWVQSTEYPACPSCGKTMRLVFQIDSEGNLPISFGDAGIGHITQCPDHKDVLGFGWACY